jgi:hypothetical protein
VKLLTTIEPGVKEIQVEGWKHGLGHEVPMLELDGYVFCNIVSTGMLVRGEDKPIVNYCTFAYCMKLDYVRVDKEFSDLVSEIGKLAEKVAPDYPGIEECDSKEQLYAIKSTIRGICMANGDLHKVLHILMEKYNITNEELENLFKRIS